MRFSGRLIPSPLRQLCSRKHAPCPSRISSAFGSRRTRPCGSSPMIPGTSWLAKLSRCAIDPTAERFSRTAQFFSRALAQLHVKGGVYIYALENAGGRRAGLLEGDIIITYGNHEVNDAAEFQKAYRERPPGPGLALTFLRLLAD